jgi:hypothetical protein
MLHPRKKEEFAGAVVIRTASSKEYYGQPANSAVINRRECSHFSHHVIKDPSIYDFADLYPSIFCVMSLDIHGKIPRTSETRKYVKLLINGTMALNMLGLEPLELYQAILKFMVPDCYDIWDFIEKIQYTMIRVKRPYYVQAMVILRQPLAVKPRKLTTADLGLQPSRNQQNQHDMKKNWKKNRNGRR